MLKNGFHNILGAASRSGLTLLTVPLLIRLIGVKEYGLWTLTSTVIGIVGLAESGLSMSTIVFLSHDLANDDAEGISETLTVTTGSMLLLATLAAIILFTGATAFISVLPKLEQTQQTSAVQALQIGGIVLWAQLLQRVLVGVEQAYQRYELMNILVTVQSALNNFGLITIAWLGGRTVAMMQWQAATSVGLLITHFWISRLLVYPMKPHLAWSKTKGLAIAQYSLKTWLTSLGGALFSQTDRLVVGAVLGTKLLGVYAAINSITAQINLFSGVSVQPLLPALSKLMFQNSTNYESLKHQIKQVLQVNGLIALGLGAGLFTLAPLVIKTIIPEAVNEEYILAFRILIIIYALYSLNAVGYYVLLGLNAVNKCMITQLISGTISLVLIAVGGSFFGMTGSVVGNAGYLGVCFLNFFGMKKLGIPIFVWMRWLKFPMIWFWTTVTLNIVIDDLLVIKILFFILQSTIIYGWFRSEQKKNLRVVIEI